MMNCYPKVIIKTLSTTLYLTCYKNIKLTNGLSKVTNKLLGAQTAAPTGRY